MNTPTMAIRSLGLCLVTSVVLFLQTGEMRADGWKAGVAAVKITPEEPMWMLGYASRTKRGEGALHDLWAKALAIEDASGHRAVLLTLDRCGIDRPTSAAVCETIQRKHGLPDISRFRNRQGVGLAMECSVPSGRFSVP